MLIGVVLVGAIVAVAATVGLGGLSRAVAPRAAGTGLVVVLLVGLAAGVSTCMALVSGLVLALTGRYAAAHLGASRRALLVPLGWFMVGRIVGFAVLGGLVGGLGSLVTLDGGPLGLLVVAASLVMLVRMSQGADGYHPADTVVYAGIPIRWEITSSTGPGACEAFLRVPDQHTYVTLRLGSNEVNLPALRPGVLAFRCVMAMHRGRLIAVPRPRDGS